MDISSYTEKYKTVLGTDIINVGRIPAYKPVYPSFRAIENRVANVPPPEDFDIVFAAVADDDDDRSGVDSMGNTQSMRPLLSTKVPLYINCKTLE